MSVKYVNNIIIIIIEGVIIKIVIKIPIYIYIILFKKYFV